MQSRTSLRGSPVDTAPSAVATSAPIATTGWNPGRGVGKTPLFALLSGGRGLVGHGLGQTVPRGPADTLDERVQDFFHQHPSVPLVAGALPFNRHADDHLVALARISDAQPLPAEEHVACSGHWKLQAEPSPADYLRAVGHTLSLLSADAGTVPGLRKVVLARTLFAESDQPIDVARLLRRLSADPSVTAFLAPLPACPDGTPRHLVGGTPELLVNRTGRAVTSHPLAGSARRSIDPGADEAARALLVASGKDKREHALVVEFILDVLAPHCITLGTPDGTAVRSTASMWHLGTRITGELRDPAPSAAELAALLHPTPAVCGVPRDRAAALIPQLELVDRGFYAGTVGWCDRAGDGAWYVSIRCAKVAGRQARLYAGAGIVPGSEPEAELDETAAKFRAMLRALGADGRADNRAATA